MNGSGKKPKRTIEELEEILKAGEESTIEILPNGEIRTRKSRSELLEENEELQAALEETRKNWGNTSILFHSAEEKIDRLEAELTKHRRADNALDPEYAPRKKP